MLNDDCHFLNVLTKTVFGGLEINYLNHLLKILHFLVFLQEVAKGRKGEGRKGWREKETGKKVGREKKKTKMVKENLYHRKYKSNLNAECIDLVVKSQV